MQNRLPCDEKTKTTGYEIKLMPDDKLDKGKVYIKPNEDGPITYRVIKITIDEEKRFD